MKFFTTRYTASLEDQVKELKEQLAAERSEVQRLNKLLQDLATDEPGGLIAVRGKKELMTAAEILKKKQPPQAGNWLKTRGQLESQDKRVTDFVPEEN